MRRIRRREKRTRRKSELIEEKILVDLELAESFRINKSENLRWKKISSIGKMFPLPSSTEYSLLANWKFNMQGWQAHASYEHFCGMSRRRRRRKICYECFTCFLGLGWNSRPESLTSLHNSNCQTSMMSPNGDFEGFFIASFFGREPKT